MSVQAGILNFDGRAADRAFLGKLSSVTEQYGPDGGSTYVDGSLGMVYRAFHTTLESRLERQPRRSSQGIVITWDGRLDNRDELMPQVWDDLRDDRTDVAIVMAAYEKWGTDCFYKLIGDWALSIWNSHDQELLLARDYLGVRHLYYYPKNNSVIWCTNLATMVLLSDMQFTLNEEYIAGFLALWPEAHLTPYREIQSVPPGKFVRIRDAEATINSYWSFDTKRQIRYKTDTEYEEHFWHVFRQAVRRRLRCDSPILAELSGGLDSSSIVCMADDIITKGEAEVPRLDTTSRYDPEEPGGDERPYFTKVEQKRGRTGVHVDVSKCSKTFPLRFHEFVATPGSFGNAPPQHQDEATVAQQMLDHRVLLSGTGGDEFTGGVPDPRPQLADLLVQFHLRELADQLMAWSLAKRIPWIQLFYRSLALLVPLSLWKRLTQANKPEPWLAAQFASRYRRTMRKMASSGSFAFRLPSQIDHGQTLVVMARQMASTPPPLWGCQERRYPFLDRSLVEFLTSIPADQLLRPGQRRSLLRRAFANLVPHEVLSRATKATSSRSYMTSFDMQWPQIENLLVSSVSSNLGYINGCEFLNALRAAKNGKTPNLVRLLRGLSLELWLQDLVKRCVIRVQTPAPLSVRTDLAQLEA